VLELASGLDLGGRVVLAIVERFQGKQNADGSAQKCDAAEDAEADLELLVDAAEPTQPTGRGP
jgi:hypothetical protein